LIAPERLIRALLLQVLYTIRSERLLEADIAREWLKVIVEQARVTDLLTDEHGSAIDLRTTRHAGYVLSQKKARKLIEGSFGWAKHVGVLRRPKVRGRREVEFGALPTFTSYTLLRMRRLIAPAFG
jgi:hypothetical protein